MIRQIKIFALPAAFGVLLGVAGWNILNWEFWLWLIILTVLVAVRDDAMGGLTK